MATVSDAPRSIFPGEPRSFHAPASRQLPILSSAGPPHSNGVEAMDVSQPQASVMGPPSILTNGNRQTDLGHPEQQQNYAAGPINGHTVQQSQPTGAAAAAQQPKVVQTAFIHKLYNMLEDPSISDLIAWSSTNESFVMSPSAEFSKVLAQYFKHTNISSFVRQLNMYGFHKVSDVFHTGSPDSPLWEFKHGGGSFKRGDLVGLREIKRRASRHALIHRDSFSSAPKLPGPPPPGPPTEPMPDPLDMRLGVVDWNIQDLYNRVQRTEDANAVMLARCQTLLDGLVKCHQWNNDLSTHILALVPDPDNSLHRDVFAMRQDIARQTEMLKAQEDPQGSPFANRQSFFQQNGGLNDPPIAMSPRLRPFDESRRPSLQAIAKPTSFRAAVPSHLQVSPRRLGSIGTGGAMYSPSSSRPVNFPPPPPPPAPPQAQHPLANQETPPGLPRRHTSADIRLQGWQDGQPPLPSYNATSSPYASGQNSTAWPSSPRLAANPGDQQIRDALAQYELPRVSQLPSRQASPPPPHEMSAPSFGSSFGGSYANSNDAGWQIPGARFPFRGVDTAPPTRRSSMASNVHSLLNPADTAEREGEDEGGWEERKRKRVL
ncbi:hypothetical protein B0A48_06742 [Cryoendolithus antarcticus]|uniref:HSF-type DNA-binding domain-containing protein n=1 Tax=Cryoendolithus antarcticus TaxID=1507870 RepID=A0A1V8T9C4_9PEZI|nr:hypothetical protein B0A48_06742 [Cryoendolithus antarcticus]